MIRALVAALLSAGALAVSTAPTAAYSCAGIGSLDRYDVVFTGKVTDVDFEAMVLTVAVDEVWKGDGVPKRVEMPAPEIGWANWNGFPTAAHTRATYGFAPERTATGSFTLPICRDWRADEAPFAQLRPAVVRQPGAVPTPITPDLTDAPLSRNELRLRQVIAGAAVIVVLGGGIIWVRRRRQAPTPGEGYSPETRPEDY